MHLQQTLSQPLYIQTDLGQVQTRGDEEWMRLFLAVGSLVSRPPPRFYLAAMEENRSNFLHGYKEDPGNEARL